MTCVGLSPLVRGKPQKPGEKNDYSGSIPACAGETIPYSSCISSRRVYPRLCGGNSRACTFLDIVLGLSPLVRGKPLPGDDFLADFGSIPACAGETSWVSVVFCPFRVYPRLCGGNTKGSHSAPLHWGLSPLVRGKPNASASVSSGNRSIPACAGETSSHVLYQNRPWVYPRLCGGNSCIQHYDLLKKNGFSILIC